MTNDLSKLKLKKLLKLGLAELIFQCEKNNKPWSILLSVAQEIVESDKNVNWDEIEGKLNMVDEIMETRFANKIITEDNYNWYKEHNIPSIIPIVKISGGIEYLVSFILKDIITLVRKIDEGSEIKNKEDYPAYFLLADTLHNLPSIIYLDVNAEINDKNYLLSNIIDGLKEYEKKFIYGQIFSKIINK